jgi:polar amino acid transport system substrate-binding protein
MRVEPCFVTPAWSQLIAGNWSDLWDIHVGSMVITTDRMENLYFTQPYTTGAAVLFVHSDNQTYHQPSDLNEKRIGVCTGCAYEDYLRGFLTIPGSDIQFNINRAIPVGYETDTSALAALAKGDGVVLDAVMTDPDTGKAAIEGGLPIKQLEEVLYYDYVSVSLDKKSSRDSVPLVRRINEIIQDMHLDGTLRDLSEEYYHGDFTAPAAEYDIQALEQY